MRMVVFQSESGNSPKTLPCYLATEVGLGPRSRVEDDSVLPIGNEALTVVEVALAFKPLAVV